MGGLGRLVAVVVPVVDVCFVGVVDVWLGVVTVVWACEVGIVDVLAADWPWVAFVLTVVVGLLLPPHPAISVPIRTAAMR